MLSELEMENVLGQLKGFTTALNKIKQDTSEIEHAYKNKHNEAWIEFNDFLAQLCNIWTQAPKKEKGTYWYSNDYELYIPITGTHYYLAICEKNIVELHATGDHFKAMWWYTNTDYCLFTPYNELGCIQEYGKYMPNSHADWSRRIIDMFLDDIPGWSKYIQNKFMQRLSEYLNTLESEVLNKHDEVVKTMGGN